jgi:hypothetical protein
VEGLSKPSQLVVQRPTRSVVFTILATLVGGTLVGRLLAGVFAPGSELADMVGVLVFPSALVEAMPHGAGLVPPSSCRGWRECCSQVAPGPNSRSVSVRRHPNWSIA